MEVFDAPTREVCQVRRIATNTPLQALVTLNDPVYVEASIAMSIRWLGSSRSDQERLRQGVFQTLSRPVEADELTRLEALLQRARAYYAERPDDAKAYLSDYPIPIDSSLDSKEVAAWAVVSSTLLNLDEFLTRP